MMSLKSDVVIAGAALLAVVLVAWYLKKKVTEVYENPEKAGAVVGSAVVEAAGGVMSGAVLTIGDWLNLPRTEQSECEKAKASGSAWDASFACPAGEFIGYVWNR